MNYVFMLVCSYICLLFVSIHVKVFAYRTALMTNLRVGIISSIRMSGGKPFSSGVGSGNPAVSRRKDEQFLHMSIYLILQYYVICNILYCILYTVPSKCIGTVDNFHIFAPVHHHNAFKKKLLKCD